MRKHLLLVDFENVQRINMGLLDESFRAIVFVGAAQDAPNLKGSRDTAHRFRRVEFQKISGHGKNALDFHIAFQLGRLFETDPEVVCIVVSADKGFDPLLGHLNKNGMECRRAGAFAEVVPAPVVDPTRFNCDRCHRTNTVEHNGEQWCPVCGTFVSPPHPLREGASGRSTKGAFEKSLSALDGQTCGWCCQRADMGDGIYDDGEWMCGACIAGFAT